MNQKHFALFALAGAACIGYGGLGEYTQDPPEIHARYAHKYDGLCSSWLTSAKTGYKYCASPPIAAAGAAVVAPAPAPEPAKAKIPIADRPTDLESLRVEGEAVYKRTCATCHGAEGLGVPGVFPPLAGAGSFYGDPQQMAKIIVGGLSGEIVVNGQTYNGVMPPKGGFDIDAYEVAAVATWVRTSFGNNDGIVLPSDVQAVE